MTLFDPMTDNRASQAYDRYADRYDDAYDSVLHQAEDLVVADLLARMIHPDNRVIDLGCGTGLGLRLISPGKPPHLYTGVDCSPKMLTKAQERHPQHEFYLADLAATGAPDRSYDVAICLYGAVSYGSSLDALAEVGRIVKPGGRFLLMYVGRGALERPSTILRETMHLWTAYDHWSLKRAFLREFDNVEMIPLSGYVTAERSPNTPNWSVSAMTMMLRQESRAMIGHHQGDAYWQIVTGTVRG